MRLVLGAMYSVTILLGSLNASRKSGKWFFGELNEFTCFIANGLRLSGSAVILIILIFLNVDDNNGDVE